MGGSPGHVQSWTGNTPESTLLAMKELTCPITLPNHQIVPVAVAIKYKPRSTGPLMLHRLQHRGSVLLVEYSVHINEEKPQVLIMRVLIPEEPHSSSLLLSPNEFTLFLQKV